MPFSWSPVLLSLFAGSATGLGGLLVLAIKGKPSNMFISCTLGFAAGVMIKVSIFELFWPQASSSWPSFFIASLWCGLGVAMTRLLQYLPLPEPSQLLLTGESHQLGGGGEGGAQAMAVEGMHNVSKSLADEESGSIQHQHQPPPPEGDGKSSSRFAAWRLGFLLMLVLTLHNFPEGIAVGLGAMKSQATGFVVCAAIFVHNVAEGIVVAVPILAGTGSRRVALLLTLASGLSEPIGAILGVIGVTSGALSPTSTIFIIDASLCLVAGIMVAVSFQELLPQARQLGGSYRDVVTAAALGMVSMFAVSTLVSSYEEESRIDEEGGKYLYRDMS